MEGEWGSGLGARGVLMSLQSPPKLWGLLFCLLGPQCLFQRDLPWGRRTCLPDRQPSGSELNVRRDFSGLLPPKGPSQLAVGGPTPAHSTALSGTRALLPPRHHPRPSPTAGGLGEGEGGIPPLWGMGCASKRTKQHCGWTPRREMEVEAQQFSGPAVGT